jgi:hypothetical protein
MNQSFWRRLGLVLLLLAVAFHPALADEVSFQSEGRASLQGWKVEVQWEKFDASEINIGSSPSQEMPAYVFDLRGDGLTVDFRNEDFKTDDSFGQGNIADPHPVTDLEAALDRAKQDVHFLYQIWVGDSAEPAGVILTPYQIFVTKSDDTLTVKLTNDALLERDVRTYR